MSKFKVGDKVRVIRNGKIGVINFNDGAPSFPLRLSGDFGCEWFDDNELELVEPAREFIVIRRDGQNVIASHKRGDEIVKTAKATCSASDTFVFETGAKLAFDRLIPRSDIESAIKAWNEPDPAPAPYVPKLYDRVMTPDGKGTIIYQTGSLHVVMHDTWDKGCNYESVSELSELHLKGNRCWSFTAGVLAPIKE